MSVRITIDGQPLEVETGATILQAAKAAGIHIPTLCNYQDLRPFGGCRLCVVEVDGLRRQPTACTMPVEDGFVVRTDTPQLRQLRSMYLRMILSEHPVCCLVCEERGNCEDCMGTVRKAGVTTGCNSCPKNGQCQLQELVAEIGLGEYTFPVRYHMLPVEKYDPFFSRDYNLCVHCGRCVRICEQTHFSSAIAFNYRGPHTVIAPAFGRSHLAGGCDFCGACVTVCPTGALMEKARKWDGIPDRQVESTCALCSLGCHLRLQVKNEQIIGALPVIEENERQGLLCVKGRFGITELVSHPERLTEPSYFADGKAMHPGWEAAIQMAAEKLATCPPEGFAMLVSPNCSNEDLYIAQKFCRVVMRSHNISTSARSHFGEGFTAYLKLLGKSAPPEAVDAANVVLCVGLDTQYTGSVLEGRLKRALDHGAKILTIHPWKHRMTLVSTRWMRAEPDQAESLLGALADLLDGAEMGRAVAARREIPEGDWQDLEKFAASLRGPGRPVILVGSDYLAGHNVVAFLEAVERLRAACTAALVLVPPQNNLVGSVLMGAYGELLPGGAASSNPKKLDGLNLHWGAQVPAPEQPWWIGDASPQRPLQVLYLIGETLSCDRAGVEHLIYQNTHPLPKQCAADLTLPSAAFTEAEGTFIDYSGRLQYFEMAVEPPGAALPDWRILCRIAERMGVPGFDFRSAEEIRWEITSLMGGFEALDLASMESRPLSFTSSLRALRQPSAAGHSDPRFPYQLTVSRNEHVYRGVALADVVEGFKHIFPVDALVMNPLDARRLGISHGELVRIQAPDLAQTLPVYLYSHQTVGAVSLTLGHNGYGEASTQPVMIRKSDVSGS